MDISNLMKSKYLRADQMQGQTQTFTIERVGVQEFGSGETKPVLYFAGIPQAFVLNQTNTRVIAAAYSTETDKWLGNPITLFATTTEYQGRTVPAIRVFVPPATPRGVSEPEKGNDPLPSPSAAGAAVPATTVIW